MVPVMPSTKTRFLIQLPALAIIFRRSARLGFLLWIGVAAAACGSVEHDLHVARVLYGDARYEDAQAWLVNLRAEYAAMTKAQRAALHFLGGMTAYRLGQADEALHELALAAHAAREQTNPLGPEQLALLYRTLEELMANRANATASTAAR
jgi:hypothetical protein